MPNLRLIPVVVFAAFCLLAIKTIGFVTGGPLPASNVSSVERELWKRLAGGVIQDEVLITGATPEAKPPAQPMAALPKDGDMPNAKSAESGAGQSPAERALIERLQERRQELEARARDLEMRENLMKAAEKQLDNRIGELKDMEGKEGGPASAERMKSLVVMYESMGPKEAARVFDRLDSRVLLDIVNQMNPRKVSEILAKMSPEAAEKLTLEMARRRAPAEQALPASDLRRIDARNGR
jgi:flagellar motility protein MotE (MotC chaperone)